MLYSQLRQVIDIDRRISSMHRELDNLYKQRAKVVNANLQDETYKIEVYSSSEITPKKPSRFKSSKTDWIENQEDILRRAWDRYGLNVLKSKKFTQILDRAYDVINELEALCPELTGQLGVVLVPPTRNKIFPANKKLRAKQPFLLGEDRLVMVDTKPEKHSNWRILVACTSPNGLAWGSADQILKTENYKRAGYDLRALGPQEYTALTLQQNYVIDTGTWTVFLRDYDPEDESTLLAASLINGQYNYSKGDKHSSFGDDRFRPAVEVIL